MLSSVEKVWTACQLSNSIIYVILILHPVFSIFPSHCFVNQVFINLYIIIFIVFMDDSKNLPKDQQKRIQTKHRASQELYDLHQFCKNKVMKHSSSCYKPVFPLRLINLELTQIVTFKSLLN